MNKIDELQNKLDQQEFFYTSILDDTLAGYFDWKVKENYEFLSPTFKKMFGYEDHEMENSPDAWQKIIFEKDLPKMLDVFEKHVKSKGKEPFSAEIRYHHKNGSIIWVFCRGKVVEWDDNNNPLRVIGSHVDITQLKQAEEVANKYAKELELKNKELEQFAYVASHDLQEPIRTISSFASILEQKVKDKLDDESYKYLNFISGSANRMKLLINGLLEYSRIGYNLDKKEINTNSVIEDVISDMNNSIKESNAQIIYNNLHNIIGNRTEIRILFQNLISNAIKFKQKETYPLIKIYSKQKKGEIQFTIEDNGIGIDVQHQKRIFSIFQRLHSTNKYEGTGIGLAHCEKITEAHQGRIWVESKSQKGSKFFFTIKN